MGKSTSNQAPRLGKLLLHKGLIRADQLDLALRTQAQTGERLGSLLVGQGAISEQQLRQCLRWQELLKIASLVAGLSASGAPLAYCQGLAAGSLNQADEQQQELSPSVSGRGKFSWSLPSRYWFSPEQRQMTYQMMEKASDKVIRFAQVKVKNSLVSVLRGHYTAGVEAYEYGTRFQADWSNKHIRLKLTYQF